MSQFQLLSSDRTSQTVLPFIVQAESHRDYLAEPAFWPLPGLWLYGNVKLLTKQLAYVPRSLGPGFWTKDKLFDLELAAENEILASRVLVCGTHNPVHQRVATVPLRWGCPRIVVVSGGFRYHLGKDLDQEPFAAARLWRYAWDETTDLIVSRRAPDKLPTYGLYNPTVDRLIQTLAENGGPFRLVEQAEPAMLDKAS